MSHATLQCGRNPGAWADSVNCGILSEPCVDVLADASQASWIGRFLVAEVRKWLEASSIL